MIEGLNEAMDIIKKEMERAKLINSQMAMGMSQVLTLIKNRKEEILTEHGISEDEFKALKTLAEAGKIEKRDIVKDARKNIHKTL